MTPTEAALRAAVLAAPDAPLPRLQLADHLDDTDRPQPAHALRLDAELATLRPWDDRFWQLSAELQRPAELADLGWLSDRPPLLCGVPDDWKSRWRAVRAFVSRWWNVPLGDAGRWGEAVAEAVAGREMPPGVREWAAFAAELAGLDKDAIRDPIGFGLLAGSVAVLEQAEGDLFWCLWRNAAENQYDTADSAVVLHRADGEYFAGNPGASWFANTTAGFALFYLLSYRADHRDVPDIVTGSAGLAARHSQAGWFDQAEVFEGAGRAGVLLPPGTWGYRNAQLFELTT